MSQQEKLDNGGSEIMDTDELKVEASSGNESSPTKAGGSKQNRKRKSTDPNVTAQKKKKKASSSMLLKNPLMQLNELKPGLIYTVESQSGPPHNPEFQVSVTVDGQKYIGRGNSKQLGKHAAAQAALASFVQFRNTPQMMSTMNQMSDKTDFTMDNDENEGCNFNKYEVHKNGSASEVLISTGVPAVKTFLPRMITEADKKNPIMLLNELHPGVSFSFISENSAVPSQRFCMGVEINGKTYEGTGQNKKIAKASAAKAVLSGLYQINYNLYALPSGEAEALSFPQTVADQISKQLMSTYNDVMTGNPEYVKWKVIAGIAMTKDEEMKEIQIVTIGTGTKCISGEHISMVGANINDCHAEIISRRCLKDFFYTNLELLLEGEADESIFIKKETGGFSLKQHIKFHLYISTAPCGDARIFSPHEESIIEARDRHPNRNSRGVLRTKIESGEGTIPVRGKQTIQTWDSILPGQDRLLTMSCSDKIASWNVLGLQGALLSYFVDPIYLDSVILGGLYHSNHLQRALFARFEGHIKDLPQKFQLNKPKMCATTSPEMRHLAKSPNFSVNWSLGLGRAEVINATTGKTETGGISRLSKRAFYQRFLNIHDRLPHTEQYQSPYPPLYVSFKNSVVSYREAQKVLNTAFTDAGLGCWIKKPIEQNEFE